MIELMVFAAGVAGGLLLARCLRDAWEESEDGRRHMAVVLAQRRVREAQAVALSQMADAAESAIRDTTMCDGGQSSLHLGPESVRVVQRGPRGRV